MQKRICLLANWTSVFSCLFSIFYPAIHSCLLFHFTSHTPPIYHPFLFLPFSHPSVTTYTSLTSLSICCSLLLSPDIHHQLPILYVYPFVSVHPTCTLTFPGTSPLSLSCTALTLSSHLWVVSNVCFTALNVFLIFPKQSNPRQLHTQFFQKDLLVICLLSMGCPSLVLAPLSPSCKSLGTGNILW